jgi:hypothetical protein
MTILSFAGAAVVVGAAEEVGVEDSLVQPGIIIVRMMANIKTGKAIFLILSLIYLPPLIFLEEW